MKLNWEGYQNLLVMAGIHKPHDRPSKIICIYTYTYIVYVLHQLYIYMLSPIFFFTRFKWTSLVISLIRISIIIITWLLLLLLLGWLLSFVFLLTAKYWNSVQKSKITTKKSVWPYIIQCVLSFGYCLPVT